jgi:hypothetical protein
MTLSERDAAPSLFDGFRGGHLTQCEQLQPTAFNFQRGADFDNRWAKSKPDKVLHGLPLVVSRSNGLKQHR